MIKVESLTKRFDKLTAVHNLTFSVGSGEVFGFIGPNGAGKTTTIRMLATLLYPDEGEAWICGHSIKNEPEKVRGFIGYMPDYFGVYDGLRVWEYLDFFAASYGIPKQKRRRAVDECMDLTDLRKLRDRMVSELSKGMKQRLCLAKTLVHDPNLLILDEPASGLDPRARIEIRSLIKELAQMGKTIFISSHILTELSDIVTMIGVIEKGELLMCGRPDEIGKRLSPHRILIFRVINDAPKAALILKTLDHVVSVEENGQTLRVAFQGKDDGEVYNILRVLIGENIPVIGLEEEKQNLENIFMKITQGEVS